MSSRILPLAAAIVTGALALAAPVAAQPARMIAISAGTFDAFENTESFELGLELTFRPWLWKLVPAVGLAANGDGALWIHAGFRRDLDLDRDWVLTPGFAVAAYEQGDSKDLGSVFEFRSSIELAYRLDLRSRVGLELYHLSNAGIDERNPGSNSLVLTYRRDL